MRSLVIFRKVALLMLLAGLAVPACSNDHGPMLLVNVGRVAGQPAPVTVHFKVLQAGGILTEKDLTWPAPSLGAVDVGLELPKGSAGAVTVTAVGVTSDSLVLSGSADGTVGGPKILLVLRFEPAPNLDAGTNLPDSGTMTVDSHPGDETANDLAQPDLAMPDQASTEVSASVETGAHDVPVDAGVPDAPNADTITDGPIALDSAPAPVDTGTKLDVGSGDVGGGVDGATRSWAQPLNVQKESGNYVFPPSVAVSPVSGDAVVVWADIGLGAFAVHYAASTNTWGEKVTVSDQINLLLAQVVVDAKGHYMMVWDRSGDGVDTVGPGIWGSFSADGVAWSKPAQFFSGGAYDWADDIRVAMNRAGQAQIVWDHFRNPDDLSVKHQLYRAYVEGTVNQPAQMVATCGDLCNPRVTIDGSGNGIVVWSQPDPVANETSVWGATFTGPTFGTPQLLENFDTDWAGGAEVAMNSLGQGMVVWQQMASSSTVDINSRRYSVTAGWDASPERVARVYSAGMMSLALDSFGTAALAWSKASSGSYQATFSSEAYGSSWNTEPIETNDLATDMYTSTDIETQIAIDGSGDVLVGWRKKISDTVFAPHSRWRSNNTWGPEAEIGMIPEMFSSDMRLAVTDDGRAVAAWTYYHCDPGSSHASDICPNAKTWDNLSAASKAAWGNIFVSAYR